MKNKVLFLLILLVTQGTFAKDIEVLIWNTKKSHSLTWSEYFLEISKKADFVLLQEATDKETVLETVKEQLNYYRFYQSWRSRVGTGVLNASKVKPYATKLFKSPSTEPILNTHKLISVEKYSIENKNLMLVNIHAINFVSTSKFEDQLNQLIPTLRKHRGPLLFAGDFNTWNSARMSFLEVYMKRLNIKKIEFQRHNRGLNLDHVYAKNFLRIKAKQLADRSTSDHHPIIVNARF